MTTFNPEKLSVDYKDGISTKSFILPRKYTLTHSDTTGDLFLTVGKDYDYDKISSMRDEVLAQWVDDGEDPVLEVFLHVDGNNGLAETVIRDTIFRRELPLALKAIVYGDDLFLEQNPNLNNARINVHFNSKVPEYNVVEEWGVINDFKYKGASKDRIYEPIPIYPYPPIPPSIPLPVQENKKTGKSRVMEMALLSMLDPYIKNQVAANFQKKSYYCLQKAEILEGKVVNQYSPCSEEYQLVIGLKVGRNPPYYNNLIITFLINENIVQVIDVKTPKGYH